MTERAPRITPHGAAWYDVALDDDDLRAMVRLSLSSTGRLAVVELVLSRWPGVTADALRSIPLGRVEAWANGAGRERVLADLDHRSKLSDDERTSADNLARQRASWGEPAPGAVETVEASEAFIAETSAKPVALRSGVRNLTLRVPEGQPKPDSFYAEVARLYGKVAIDTPRPAVALAEANGVPVSQVHGWVKEARRRGLLAPGERQARRQR
jgi:hypothetical protein